MSDLPDQPGADEFEGPKTFEEELAELANEINGSGGPDLVPHAEPDPVVGAIVRRLREENGMSLMELAAAAGLEEPMVEQIEGGTLDATWGRLRVISSALGTSIDRLADAVVDAEALVDPTSPQGPADTESDKPPA